MPDDPLAELRAADAMRFRAMVKDGARWLEGRTGLPLEKHSAVRAWLHSMVRSILECAGVPTLLAAEVERDALRVEVERLDAAEAVCEGVNRLDIFDGHLTPTTPDETHPEPYCFECTEPFPCEFKRLYDAVVEWREVCSD